jgi:hypothetical protein
LSLEMLSSLSFCCLFLSFFLWCCLSSLEMDALKWKCIYSISRLYFKSYQYIHWDNINKQTLHSDLFPFHQTDRILDKIGKVYSLEYTDIPQELFMLHHACHCCTNMIWGHCCASGHS